MKKQKYSDKSFWKKVTKFAMKAGKKVILKTIVMWEALKDNDTPLWARTTIMGALAYFISPVDAIPDMIPVVGYSDDLGVLIAAMGSVAMHVKKRSSPKSKENN
jgi:uncharacterized membrane protein YkvA (DUF1232 family)